MTSTSLPAVCIECGDDITNRADQRNLGKTSGGAPRYVRYHRDCYREWQMRDRQARAAGLVAYKALLSLDDDADILRAVRTAQAEQDAA